ncbi:hypothetical protein F5884DRAFT_704150 [Xylogone sp. PMI_703]|nr:hypothetical protein F5884DRAFT_704150 [Xylogone sp. PMI_703]
MPPKVAIVSGAASGLGLELTRNLLADGWKVVMVDVNSVQGERLSKDFGPNTVFRRTDVSNWDEHADLFRFAYVTFGRIDLVAANAGITDQQNLYERQSGELQKPNLKTVEVDLIAVIYALWLAAHYFRKNGKEGGKIIMTASSAGLYPFPTNPQYAVAKHGIVGLVRSVAPIFAKENINCICPAFVPTNLAPADLLNAWPPEHITPIGTIMKAFKQLIAEPVSGQVLEASLDLIEHRPVLPYINESERYLLEESAKLWEDSYKTKL